MTAHIHAELMAQYAQDAMRTNTPWELWECRRANSNDTWDELETHPAWCEYGEYRRKPRNININGHEVPEPVREPLGHKAKYFIPAISGRYFATEFYWCNDDTDSRFLERGLVHLTEEAAIAHAKALLSFTAKPEVSDE